jgi:predicted nucleic-acid-binding Zn-ribbon protein
MFGSTKCVKCDGLSFKLQEIAMQGAAYKMMAAQCTSCQTPFGITEFLNTGALLQKQENAIGELGQRLSRIESAVDQIGHLLNSMQR